MKRPGRPRKSVRRQPNGQPYRPPMRDKGTNELQDRRNYLAGKGDPTLTTFPLGILLANSTITEEEYRAGCRFAWLHAVVIGSHSLAAVEFERTHGRSLKELDEDREKKIQALWRESLGSLPSRRTRDELVSLCIYERTARFMRPVIPVIKDIVQGNTIKAGLKILAREYGFLDSKRRVA